MFVIKALFMSFLIFSFMHFSKMFCYKVSQHFLNIYSRIDSDATFLQYPCTILKVECDWLGSFK